MSPKWKWVRIVVIVLLSVLAGMVLLTCGVLRWAPLETPVHAAQPSPDPWQGLARGWGLLTFMNERAEVVVHQGLYQILNNNIRNRRSPLPIPGDVIKMEREVEIEILEYATKGFQRSSDFPGDSPAHPSKETGISIPAGTSLRIDEVRVVRLPGSDVLQIWALIKKP